MSNLRCSIKSMILQITMPTPKDGSTEKVNKKYLFHLPNGSWFVLHFQWFIQQYTNL
jgi:hypothetical protein